jgi:hypothetical protein
LVGAGRLRLPDAEFDMVFLSESERTVDEGEV